MGTTAFQSWPKTKKKDNTLYGQTELSAKFKRTTRHASLVTEVYRPIVLNDRRYRNLVIPRLIDFKSPTDLIQISGAKGTFDQFRGNNNLKKIKYSV